MSSQSNRGIFNPAYHDSETLEMDKRSPSRSRHTNPYAGEWSGVRPKAYSTSIGQSSDMERESWVDRPEQSWSGGQNIPMGPLTTQPEHPAWRHDLNHSTFPITSEDQYEQSLSVRMSSLPSVHKCHALLTYNRQALLDIANSRNFVFSGSIPLELQLIVRPQSHHRGYPEGHEAPASSEFADPRRVLRRRRRKRGKRGGLHARLKARASRPPLPSLLLANVRSLENKLDELRTRILTQREIRECCALIFTETWLSDRVPENAIQLQTHSLHRGDRTAASGNMTMRWRGPTMRRMNNTDPNHLQFAEEAIMNQLENEEQNLIQDLVAMSTRDRIWAFRELPLSFKVKKHIRSHVLALISSKKSHQMTCCSDCSERVSRSFRRCGINLRFAWQTLDLWQGTMKEIGGKFGTSVLSYFVFLKWLLMFNVFSFLVNFGFITIPQLVYEPSPHIPVNTTFRGLEILTGAGYFNNTVMYYGSYSNGTLVGAVVYDIQLGYFFTVAIYMVLCGIALIFSMANSFKKNYILAVPTSSAWQLLCSWDFSITNERAVRQRKNNLRIQLKESLSEKAQSEQLTISEKLEHFGVHLGSWLLSTSLTVGCGASIYFLCQYEKKHTPTDTSNWTLLQEAETLLVPFVVSLMNMVVPLFFSLFNKFEHYSTQRRQIYALVVRNVLLRLSILGVLCYYWMIVVAKTIVCWESVVGQALYRLVIVDFLFLILGSFFGEFLSNVVGTRLLPRWGVPEFDVARNVLDIIYAQTLAWIGIYFSPLLPAIQIIKFFVLFYLKKVSLMQNCQPPRRTGRAAQMKTIFTALLFFPFFVGALSIVGYTTWSLTPSEQCGPFRGLNNTFSVVEVWIDRLKAIPGSQWVIFIYQNVIRSEIFYFLITIIILVVVYIFWQVTQGRKQLIVLLKKQIVNEGKDKSFLLEKLQNLQKSQPNKRSKQKSHKKSKTMHHSDDRSSSNSNAMVQVLLARQRLEEEQRQHAIAVPVPLESTTRNLTQAIMTHHPVDQEDGDLYDMIDQQQSSSSALVKAMQARQRAEGQSREEYYSRAGFTESHMNYRHRAEEEDDNSPASVTGIMMQVMQARQRAEEEEELKKMQLVPTPPQNPASSSALIQAMLARQQAQNEYDDGY